MPFPYKTVLITGATSGIGLALAERMLDAGIFVIAVGRRKDRLDELVAKHGSEKVAAEVFDVSKLDKISEWAKKITTTYPQLDSIVLNAGFQRTLDFTNPESINLPLVDAEMTTNYLSPLHTVAAFLPHLIALGSSSAGASPRPASIILVTSSLGMVPMARCANYCATKAALHSLAWTLRSQLGNPSSSHTRHIAVIEVVPPAVQTELHSQQEDLVRAGHGNIGMPLDAWADETWAAMRGDGTGADDDGAAGTGQQQQGEAADDWADEHMVKAQRNNIGQVEVEKRKAFKRFEAMMRGQKNQA